MEYELNVELYLPSGATLTVYDVNNNSQGSFHINPDRYFYKYFQGKISYTYNSNVNMFPMYLDYPLTLIFD